MPYSPYGSQANCKNDTYGELTSKVDALYSYIQGLEDLKNNQVAFGEILTKLNDLCEKVNQHTTIVSGIQTRTYALETSGPIITCVTRL